MTGPDLVRERADLAARLDAQDRTAPTRRYRRAVVMTMGALHAGHLALVEKSLAVADHVVVTIFVNPLQFAPSEDLDTYPRDLGHDVTLLTGAAQETGVGRLVVFAPTPDVMYPGGDPTVRVDPGPMATVLEGATRPTHFAGVCQVVLKLLQLTRPDWALFGRKDAQQLAVVRAMVRDLDVPVEIVPVEIRREADGLAMSSRNAYLSVAEREHALALSRSLALGRAAAERGMAATQVLAATRSALEGAEGVELDYVALVDPDGFVDLTGDGPGLPAVRAGDGDGAGPGHGDGTGGAARQGLLALAARVGSTRLIDNTLVDLAD